MLEGWTSALDQPPRWLELNHKVNDLISHAGDETPNTNSGPPSSVELPITVGERLTCWEGDPSLASGLCHLAVPESDPSR